MYVERGRSVVLFCRLGFRIKGVTVKYQTIDKIIDAVGFFILGFVLGFVLAWFGFG